MGTCAWCFVNWMLISSWNIGKFKVKGCMTAVSQSLLDVRWSVDAHFPTCTFQLGSTRYISAKLDFLTVKIGSMITEMRRLIFGNTLQKTITVHVYLI